MATVYLSVVTPVYGCGESLQELCTRLNAVLLQISANYEIILVNDASPDDAWDTIKTLASIDPRIKGINLSRNFGQHYAITAGLDYAEGDWVVVMDCDLQDVPEEILKLHSKALEGFDLVVGLRTNRQDNFFKRLESRLLYQVFSYLSDTKINNRIGNFGIYSHRVIKHICALKEQNRSFGLFAIWVGFRRAEIDIIHAKRPLGTTSYSLKRMIALAFDSITAHSNKLLHMSVMAGFLLSVASLIYVTWLIMLYFIWVIPVVGWTSLIVSVFFTTGLIMGAIGILGLYIGKVFDEVKDRPLYIVESTTFEMYINDK